MTMPRHGTYARFQKEYKEGGMDAVCDRCRKARNTKHKSDMRRKRAGTANRETQRSSLSARQQALNALAERHPEEYAELLRKAGG